MTNNEPDYKDNLYFPEPKEGENSFKATFDSHFSLKKTEGLEIKNDLTIDWNNGKLPLGWYYVRYSSDEIEPAEYMAWYNDTGWYRNAFEREEDIVKVIDAVPSYEDSMTMKDCVRKEFEAVEKYAELKEVLKECREEIASVDWDSPVNERNQINLLTKIDEALK